VRLAQDLDDVAGPGLQPAGAEFRDGAASPDDVGCALLDAGLKALSSAQLRISTAPTRKQAS
jgi:hypothetical protein